MWREVNQQMHVIVLAIHLRKFSTSALADIIEDDAHRIEVYPVKHLLAVLRGEDQMCVQQKHTMAT